MKLTLTRLAAFAAFALVAFLLAASPTQETAKKTGATPEDSAAAVLKGKVTAILKTSCATSGCHTGERPKMRLALVPAALDTLVNRPSRQIDTLLIIDAKRPDKSYILMKIRGDKGIRGSRMPDDAPPLKPETIQTIELWIKSLSTRTR